ncbi:MAG: hypothetical protein HOP03_03450 [Lysobacter sp.]|nr:hypothetical protein [Lysobacter sp.]
MTDDTILLLCGLHSLGFAAFHIAFWALFRWPKTLASTNVANRAILQIANVQLIWIFLCIGGLCLRFPYALIHTALGRAVMLGMSGFWVLRLIQQFVFLRVNHPLVHVLSVLFALGAVLFALPIVR